jgi:succinate dehydrogenase flavin-adding protein (antitoxin of CptAB toxin-antitoxin module)
MANTGSDNTNRPDVMDSLTETQLSELENQFDENDRDQFNTLAGSYGWDTETCQRVWDWLSSGRRREGFQGKQP